MVENTVIRLCLFCAIISSIIPFTSLAEEPIQIDVVSDEWQGFVTQDGTGYYLDLLRLVFPAPKYNLNISIYPYTRALYKVQHNNADIVLGIWANEHPNKQLSSFPIETDILDAVVRQGHTVLSKPEAFDQLRVLAQTGYGFDELLNNPSSYEEHVELSRMLKMIQVKRADVLLGYQREIAPVLLQEGLENELEIQQSVLVEHAYLGFCSSEKCSTFKQHYDKRFLELHHQSIIKQLLIDNDLSPHAEPRLVPLSPSP